MGKKRKFVGVSAAVAIVTVILAIAFSTGAKEFTKEDLKRWDNEFMTVVIEGEKLFHSSSLGTNKVSCDQCHPNAANTHPETYPKFQTQLGRVVLLRDMINWCIDNPVRGEHLEPDDPRMRALEAYIMAQRSGTQMNYGKH